MRTLELEVPDRLAQEIDELIRSGWFADEQEVARQALRDFVRQNRLRLQQDFQQQDISWALQLQRKRAP